MDPIEKPTENKTPENKEKDLLDKLFEFDEEMEVENTCGNEPFRLEDYAPEDYMSEALAATQLNDSAAAKEDKDKQDKENKRRAEEEERRIRTLEKELQVSKEQLAQKPRTLLDLLRKGSTEDDRRAMAEQRKAAEESLQKKLEELQENRLREEQILTELQEAVNVWDTGANILGGPSHTPKVVQAAKGQLQKREHYKEFQNSFNKRPRPGPSTQERPKKLRKIEEIFSLTSEEYTARKEGKQCYACGDKHPVFKCSKATKEQKDEYGRMVKHAREKHNK